jgi:hypothetical protein
MILFPGGLSKVEFAATNSFPGTEIPGVMKETKVTFKTPTEEDAAGRAGATGKQVDFTVVSKDMTDTPYATLRGYEAAATPIFLKFTGINTAQSLVLKSVMAFVELQPNETGKNWKRIVQGSGFAGSETDLLTLTLS